MRAILHKIAKVNKHYKFYISLVLAFLIFFAATGTYPFPVSFMAAWITYTVVNLFFSWSTILTFDARETGVEVSAPGIKLSPVFAVILLSCFISLFAIILLINSLPETPKGSPTFSLFIPSIAVTCSWLLIHTIFTQWYAHSYYSYLTGSDGKPYHHKGLLFPGDEDPEFSDFAYFAFGMGMTFQVSDVQITSKQIRRMALLHSMLSFVYNTIIVALSINIISGIL